MYPFSAVVGMDELKLALLINAVHPGVGGVLVRGEKGTAKSTAVRALSALLPDIGVVDGCRFSCDPVAPDPGCPDAPHAVRSSLVRPARLVELPVGASEDRLVGSLDIERALAEGVKAYEPGLLAAAHRGLLYVDEVNLLHDHLVDLLLDAAALGTCYIEREGVSVRHAARFLLVGTMNPEEGELRPQLLDRFGVTVEVTATRDPAERADVVRRRLAYEEDPDGFRRQWAGAEAELSKRIAAARSRLPHVRLGDAALRQITAVCAAFEVDGLRADLVMARAATALAAWHAREAVTAEDVRVAARLALPHRRRRDPFDAPGLDEQRLDEALERESGEGPDDDPGRGGGAQEQSGSPEEGARTDVPPNGGDHAEGIHSPPEGDEVASLGQAFRPRLLSVLGIGTGAPGRRSRARTPYGHVSGARPRATGTIHLTATLRAAAPHQRDRGRDGRGLLLTPDDLREPVREGKESNLVLFAVDASGSMAARQRMSAVKGAVLSLLLDAYQRRDKIGMITFRGGSAELALPPTSSVEAGARRLRDLATGGRTPLAAGLLRAAEVLRIERLKDPARRALLVVVTDGRATHGHDPVGEAHRAAALLAEVTASIVIDCEAGPVRLGLAETLAARLGGDAVRVADLAAEELARTVRDSRGVYAGVRGLGGARAVRGVA